MTNGHFNAFSPVRRVDVAFRDLKMLVLPELTAAAEGLFIKAREERAARKAVEFGGPPQGKRARRPLREADPW